MLKKLITLFTVLYALVSCNSQVSEHVTTIKVKEFEEALNQENIQLIDVRTQEEFDTGHIKNAKSIDYFSESFKENLQGLNKKEPVYLYCRSGRRSMKAAKVLSELGFTKIFNLEGGYMAWKVK